MPGPYEGLFVLDAAQGIAGPYCGMLLAQAGARVVKLEPPKGDWSRGLTTRSGSHSVMHTAFNRGKEAFVLDLTSPQDQARAAKLAARADVLIEAFRPGVAARIGLGPEAAKPDAVCISISGFGQEGPYRERPCTDGVAQAYGGLVASNVGADGIPHRLTTLPVDVFSGLAAFAAAQSALAEQARDRREGKPPRCRHLDVSLMQSVASLLALPIGEAGLLGRMPAELNVPAGTYQGSDGVWFMVSMVREEEWHLFCRVLDRPDLPSDPRFLTYEDRAANKAALMGILRPILGSRPAGEWIAKFQAARMLSDRVNTPLDLLADPHARAVNVAPVLDQPGLGRLPLPATPGIGAWNRPAPALGEHTDAILREIEDTTLP